MHLCMNVHIYICTLFDTCIYNVFIIYYVCVFSMAKVVSCHLYRSASQNLYPLPTPVPLKKGVFACPFLGLLRLHGATAQRWCRPNQKDSHVCDGGEKAAGRAQGMGMQLEGVFMENGVVDSWHF